MSWPQVFWNSDGLHVCLKISQKGCNIKVMDLRGGGKMVQSYSHSGRWGSEKRGGKSRGVTSGVCPGGHPQELFPTIQVFSMLFLSVTFRSTPILVH